MTRYKVTVQDPDEVDHEVFLAASNEVKACEEAERTLCQFQTLSLAQLDKYFARRVQIDHKWRSQ